MYHLPVYLFFKITSDSESDIVTMTRLMATFLQNYGSESPKTVHIHPPTYIYFIIMYICATTSISSWLFFFFFFFFLR